MSHPSKKSFKVYNVCRIDFANRSYGSVRFFKEPKDAELLRGDLTMKYAEDQNVMFIVEYCDRSEIP